MSMKLLHAVAAVLTMVLLFIRQRLVIAAVSSSPVKHGVFEHLAQTCHLRPRMSLLSENCMECARAACLFEECRQPKYKRDPDISVDNVRIGEHPPED